MSYRGSASSLSALPLSSAAALAKAPTALEQLLEEINFQRTKEMRQMLKDDSGFVMVHGTTYWTDLFVRHFLFQTDRNIDCDDLLFFVRKKHIKSSSRILPKFETEVDVFRKASRKLPIGDPDMDWEETVYLNLIIHQFDYTLTLAICTRTSPKELQVLRRHSQKVYASPSRRRMDTKAEVEEMTYPNVCFMVDNFNEVFSDIMVRDGEMVCVELVASDRDGAIQGVIFLGSIRYDALKRVYDARSSLSSKMAQRMTFGLFSNSSSQRVEFVRMKGPQGKGHAEMAVTKPKGYSGAETPTSEPGYCATDMWDSDWDSDPEEFFVYRHQRRLSDPSANINNFVRGGWKTKPSDSAGSKARSENEGLDSLANGLNEIEAGDLRDDCEFCVHSASISTSDASPPSRTSNTITKATSSSGTATTSTTSATLFRSLPPAPSIISSFFPNCNSRRPGRAVQCVSQTDGGETLLSECKCTDEDLLNVPENRCHVESVPPAAELLHNAEESSKLFVEDREMPTHEFNNSAANQESKKDDVDTISIAETSQSHDRGNELMHVPDNNKLGETEGSDDEFEDCNSLMSDASTSIQSQRSCDVNEEPVESESQGDVWSDAEEDVSQTHDIPELCETDKSFDEDHFIERESTEFCGNDVSKTDSDLLQNEQIRKKNVINRKIEICNAEGNENLLSTKVENLILQHSNEEEKSNPEHHQTNVQISLTEGEEKQTVIISCEEENVKTASEKCSFQSTVNEIVEEPKTDFEVCAHGIEMTSLCLLCLGYSKNSFWQKSDCTFRLKREFQCSKSNEYRSDEGPAKKTEHSTSFFNAKSVQVDSRSQVQLNCDPQRYSHGMASQLMEHSQTIPRRRKSESSLRHKRNIVPPHKILPDGTVIYYWCDVPGGLDKSQNELDDGAYNPLWTMRGFTQTFHFWKENKRAQSVPLNAFLTYVTLPWWSIVKDILDHRESPILTF